MSVLRLNCRFSPRAGFEIRGNALGLHMLMKALSLTSGETKFDLQNGDDNAGAAPYDEIVRKLVVRANDGLVWIGREAESITFTGCPDRMKLLVENIGAIADDACESSHLHVEYFSEHFYLDKESEPLIVVREDY